MGAKSLVGLAAAMFVAGFVAVSATGNHGSDPQSTCLRSKQPDGSIVTQSLTPSDPDGQYCGQWICNAPTLAGAFTNPQPCMNPPLSINLVSDTVVAVKPITVPAGQWTLNVYLKDLGSGATQQLTWTFGASALEQQTRIGSAHWTVSAMTVSGADAGAFELWFGDPLPA